MRIYVLHIQHDKMTMKNVFLMLVAAVVFLAILEVNASRSILEESTVFSTGHYGLDKSDTLPLEAKEAMSTMNAKEDSGTDMIESYGEERDSSTNTHHYFSCAKQSDCNSEIHT
ncbi:uncharacterized protein LOC112522290 [Cynara cardunculus var. scolymus]|uniref:uncharacterized protein LOC112522290 n=1 Tax=Cynara cardunculus var. scolymus TaxID=59895 RepID=UPI000D62AA7D|nr:uncharacterized protein LOC112522290 [Cynara cardunculus var. scolymus]